MGKRKSSSVHSQPTTDSQSQVREANSEVAIAKPSGDDHKLPIDWLGKDAFFQKSSAHIEQLWMALQRAGKGACKLAKPWLESCELEPVKGTNGGASGAVIVEYRFRSFAWFSFDPQRGFLIGPMEPLAAPSSRPMGK